MKNSRLTIALSLALVCLCGQISAFAAPQATDLEHVLSWLPVDTETVFVSNGPFSVPATFHESERGTDNVREQEVDRLLQRLPMALFDIREGLLLQQLKGLQVQIAVEGSRHARSPNGLGMQPYEGAAIVVFAPRSQINPHAVLQELERVSNRSEEIEGVHVLVFQQKMEGDLWTTYAAFPGKNVAVVASNRDYLRTVLTRRKNGAEKRALPDSLPEWRAIDRNAPYFGIRHYDRNQAQSDPSSPFGGKKAANFPDERAVGFAFSIGGTNPRRVSMTYFSGDPTMKMEESPLQILATSPDAHGIDSEFQSAGSGTLQVSCSFKSVEGLDFFLLVLEGFMGHTIYL